MVAGLERIEEGGKTGRGSGGCCYRRGFFVNWEL